MKHLAGFLVAFATVTVLAAQPSSNHNTDYLSGLVDHTSSEAARNNSLKTSKDSSFFSETINSVFSAMNTPEIMTYDAADIGECDSEDCSQEIAQFITGEIMKYTSVPELFPLSISDEQMNGIIFQIVSFRMSRPEMTDDQAFEELFPRLISESFSPDGSMGFERSLSRPDPGRR